MRVIWVTPAMPHPAAAGGWAHEFEMIRALAGRHEIEVVSAGLDETVGPGALLEAGTTVTRVDWQLAPYPPTRARLAVAVIAARPTLNIARKADRLDAIERTVRAVDERSPADLVHVTQQELAPLVGRVRAPTALLLYDSLTREIQGRLEVERSFLRRMQLHVERRRSRAFERRWYPRADALAAVSDVDADWIGRETGCEVRVLEVAVPDRLFEPISTSRSRSEVTFVGSLNHQPNEDAITWLVEDIWPSVVAQRPDATLVIAGRDGSRRHASRRLRPLVEAVGGRLHVDVPDVRPFFGEAAVVVAPMRFGGGMKTKVVHALATGAPLVATPFALEGVPAEARRHVSVASTATDIASAIVTVLGDPATAAERGRAASAAVQSLSTSAVSARFESWWQGLVS